jgi:hypothetical protein
MFAKIWVQHDQGEAIGLAFKLFDWFFHVVRVLGIVVERGVVRTYARTSNITNGSDERDQTNKHTTFGIKL